MTRHPYIIGLVACGTLLLAACTQTPTGTSDITSSSSSSSLASSVSSVSSSSAIVEMSSMASSVSRASRSSMPTRSSSAVSSRRQSSSMAPASVSMLIQNFSFGQANLTVKAGTTVTWTNKDSAPHTVTGDTGGPASGMLGNGQSYSYTFMNAGTFSYHCTVHPMMKGVVIVTP